MTDATTWQEANTRYLSAAVAWVRALLESRGGRAGMPAPPPPKPAEEPRGWWRRGARTGPQTGNTSPPIVLIAQPSGSPDKVVAQAAADMNAAGAQMKRPPALVLLCERLGLTPLERNLLILCTAMELDTSVAALCARVHADPARPYPTFALALSIFDDPAWDLLSPDRPPRYWRLIEIHQASGQALTTSPIRADERIVNYLKGLTYLDDRLTPLVSPLAIAEEPDTVPASQRAAAQMIIDQLRQAPQRQNVPVIQLLGVDCPSKHLVAGIASAPLARRPYRIHWSLIPSSPADLETFARLWERESLLMPVALYVDTQGMEGEGMQSAQATGVNRLLTRLNSLVFLDTRDPLPGLPQTGISVDVAKPTPDEQQAAWTAALGDDAGDSPQLLSGQFKLNLESIREIARKARSETAPKDQPLHTTVWFWCLAATRPRLDMLAQRIEPKATWDDIVLPAAETTLLHQIADQVAQRATVYQKWGFDVKLSGGLGISVLLAGESGTGKTMAAEVIANHLRLNLYRIDLSAVVSKYIGETEKNLRRLFDAAEDGGVILFFDEADALFGKRSEVKDSHDRYANIEINYLLQRMETYSGLSILATNMKSGLDPAFLRRLRHIVNLPYPGPAERKAMWRKVFPPGTPTSGLDFDRLARLPLVGGHITDIALNAAFMAAHAGGEVTMPLVFAAARNEFRKLERPANEADFRWPVGPVRVA